MSKRKVVWQSHHCVYASKEHKTKDVVRRVRRGVHRAICIIQRFNYLTDQEIDTLKLECELKRKYEDE